MVISELLNALNTAFKKEFGRGLSLVKPQWEAVAMRVSSNTKLNTYGILSQFPKMQEWSGSRTIKKLKAEAMQIENKLFESTVAVPRTDIEDDQVGLFAPIMAQAGQSAAELPDDLVFSLLAKGKETNCYDGKHFFAKDHPVYKNVDGTGSKTSQSNLTTGSAGSEPTFYILDTTNTIKPLIWQERIKPEFETKFDPNKSDKVFMEDVYLWGIRARGNAGFGFWQLAHCVEQTALTAESVMAAVTQMQSLKGDGEKLLNIRPSVLLVPPSLEFKARQICEAEVIEGTTNILHGRLTVMVSPYL